jgi:hypothetical protein
VFEAIDWNGSGCFEVVECKTKVEDQISSIVNGAKSFVKSETPTAKKREDRS